MWDSMKEVIFNKHPLAIPKQEIPLNQLAADDFATSEQQPLRFVRLGHSTVLIEMSGKYWLTDPVFSERASPVQWMGPKRFHKVPLNQQDLPEIEAVIISHNHYDHLDHGSIQQLKDKLITLWCLWVLAIPYAVGASTIKNHRTGLVGKHSDRRCGTGINPGPTLFWPWHQ